MHIIDYNYNNIYIVYMLGK